MPQTLALLAQQAGAAAASAAAAAGAGATIQSIAALIAYTATYAAAAAAGVAITSALAPDAPRPEAIKANKKQARPPRVSGNGIVRLGGAYMLFEASGNVSADVLALHDGLTDGPTGRYWLHDDEAEIDGSGWVVGFDGKRYTPQHVKILTRRGLASETAYGEVVSLLPSVWTTDHRGDGIASLAMLCNHSDLKYYTEDFPSGLPQPSAEWRLAPTFDPRDPSQDPNDPSTFLFTGPSGSQGRNAALCLLHYLCFAEGGPQISYSRRILPVVEFWKAGADVCDELVALKGGGAEPRYQLGGAWTWDSSPSSIIRNYLDACDGWLSPDGFGNLVFYAGRYTAPGPSDIITSATAYTVARYSNDENAVNELVVSFVSPDHAYNQVETTPWRDETDILERGEVKSDQLQLIWVQSNGQARRLAKRSMSDRNATASGTITTDLSGLDQMGKRWLRIALPEEIPTLRDLAVQVKRAEVDWSAKAVTFTWTRADPLVDSWNPAVEEGDGVDVIARPDQIYAPVPTILDVVPFFDSIGGGSTGVRLQVISNQPVTEDILYSARWRVAGGVSYEIGPPQEETAISGGSYITTGFVPADSDVEVQLAGVTASGSYTDWSVTFPVNTSTENVAPAMPTDLAATGAAGTAHISWRNPSSLNLDHLVLYRGTTAVFGSAAPVGSPLIGGLGAVMEVDDTLAAGTYYYWIEAFNANGDGSGPLGPDSATVT